VVVVAAAAMHGGGDYVRQWWLRAAVAATCYGGSRGSAKQENGHNVLICAAGKRRKRRKKENMPVSRSHLYLLGRARTVRPTPAYIYRFPIKTNEYKFIFIGFETDEYNLNIFIGTDEFKNPDE
jgi:hypothetical protein